jgi:Clostripain family
MLCSHSQFKQNQSHILHVSAILRKGFGMKKGKGLTMTEIRDAMGALGQKFDVVYFDSCLMAGLEVAYQIKDEAMYVTFSEDLLWTTVNYIGWGRLILQNCLNDAKKMAHLMATIYRDTFNHPKIDAKFKNVFTISVADLSKIDDVHMQVNAMAQSLIIDMDNIKERDIKEDNLQVRWANEILPKAHDFDHAVCAYAY